MYIQTTILRAVSWLKVVFFVAVTYIPGVVARLASIRIDRKLHLRCGLGCISMVYGLAGLGNLGLRRLARRSFVPLCACYWLAVSSYDPMFFLALGVFSWLVLGVHQPIARLCLLCSPFYWLWSLVYPWLAYLLWRSGPIHVSLPKWPPEMYVLNYRLRIYE